jgi:predicted amidohydrolase
MASLKVALVQARSRGADPERALRDGERAEWLAHATTLDGPFVSYFRALARELGVAIVITYLEAWPGAPRNTATLIDRHGDTVLTYATWPRSTSATGARSRSAASGTTARATRSSTSSSRAARARSS